MGTPTSDLVGAGGEHPDGVDMTEDRKKGWHPDPYGIHADRYYFLDNQPGRLVRDWDGHESYDDIPVEARDSSPALSGWAGAHPDDERPPTPAPDPPDLAAPPEADEPRRTAPPAGVPTLSSPPRRQSVHDHFPDDPVRWRTSLADWLRTSLGRLRGAPASWRLTRPKLSTRSWLSLGAMAAAGTLVIVLIATLSSGPDTSPSSPAASPGTVARTPPSTTAETGSARWQVAQTFSTASLAVNAVACPDPQVCFAVGETTLRSGLVEASVDGGMSWVQQNVPAGVGTLAAISCASPTVCLAVGGITVVTTVNGGATWTVQLLGKDTLSAIACPSVYDCVVAGADRRVASECDSGSTYTTRDGGLTWATTTLNCFVPVGVACSTVSNCALVGTQHTGPEQYGQIMRSKNGGDTWLSELVLHGANSQLNAVACPTVSRCLAVGVSPTQPILSTSNGGQNWVTQSLPQPIGQRSFLAVACESALVCHTAGSALSLATVDGGKRWAVVGLPASMAKITGLACPTVSTCIGSADGVTAGGATLRLSS